MKRKLLCAVLFSAIFGVGTAFAQAPQDIDYRTADRNQLEEKLRMLESQNNNDRKHVKEKKSVVKEFEKELKKIQSELKREKEQLKKFEQAEKASRNEIKAIKKAMKLRNLLNKLSN